MRNIEENRHLTEDRARLGCGGDLKIPLQHFDLSLDENVENAALLLFDQEHFTGAEGPFRKPLAITQNCPHRRTSARRQYTINGNENRQAAEVIADEPTLHSVLPIAKFRALASNQPAIETKLICNICRELSVRPRHADAGVRSLAE
jgi:hypothetical protein